MNTHTPTPSERKSLRLHRETPNERANRLYIERVLASRKAREAKHPLEGKWPTVQDSIVDRRRHAEAAAIEAAIEAVNDPPAEQRV